MEQGTGKTFTTLVSIAKRNYRQAVDSVLIIAPASAIDVWYDEIQEHLKGWPIRWDIISYDYVRRHKKLLRKLEWDAVVCDESHKLKNPNSKQSKAVKIFGLRPSVYRYALTGTMLADDVMDLFAQFRFVDPSILGKNWTDFQDEYVTKGGFMGVQRRMIKSNRKKVLQLVRPYTYEIRKDEALDLPPETHRYLWTDLKGSQKITYNKMLLDSFVSLDDSKSSALLAVTQVMRLQQITGGFINDDEKVSHRVGEAKLELLQEYLDDHDPKEKLVIFARFKPEIKAIKSLCEKNKFTVEVHTSKDKGPRIRFQEEENPRIIICQIQSGGIAIDLFRANRSVLYSKTYSRIEFEQAKARLHRAGQTKSVTHTSLMVRETVDEEIEAIVKSKQSKSNWALNYLRRLKDEYDRRRK